jgi:hypothetical protein
LFGTVFLLVVFDQALDRKGAAHAAARRGLAALHRRPAADVLAAAVAPGDDDRVRHQIVVAAVDVGSREDQLAVAGADRGHLARGYL